MEVETDGGKVFGLPAVSSFLRRIKLKTRIKKKKKDLLEGIKFTLVHNS